MRDPNMVLARNVRRVGHLDIPGGGQVVVQGGLAFVGHMQAPHGTSIIDVSDPTRPRVLTTIMLDNEQTHSHKVRVVGDLMITNVERAGRGRLRKAERLLVLRTELRKRLGRDPSDADLAAELEVEEADVARLAGMLKETYNEGGFRLWDISRPETPRLLHHERTHGVGVHRFDMDAGHAYISTEMEGYAGNILVIYDLKAPARPSEVSRWWLPGQHVSGGEKPAWSSETPHRLHHAMRQGDKLWAAMWHGGLRVIDISDMTNPRTVGAYDYHPQVPQPTHTFLPLERTIGGRRIAVVADEEMQHRHGQPHAGLWVFDVTDPAAMRPLSTFHLGELDSPWSQAGGRFGLHQFQEHVDDTLVYCAWFAGGLRVIDVVDPMAPREVGYFIPEPLAGESAPQSNDVDVDGRGLIYLLDRNRGLDILEYTE